MRGLANGGIVHVQVITNGPHHHLAGVQADAHVQLQAVGPAHLFSVAAERGLHRQGRVTGPHGVIFVSHGRPEEGHDAIAEHLIHRPLKAVHGVHHVVQRRIEECLGSFRVEIADQLRGAFEVGKEHRHLLALAFQGAAGRENLLGEIGRCVGERGRSLHRFGGGDRRDLTCPDQHGALLIPSTLLDLNDFHLQVVEVRVIEIELALERPVRDAATLAEQC
jgi:hypothetical protein